MGYPLPPVKKTYGSYGTEKRGAPKRVIPNGYIKDKRGVIYDDKGDVWKASPRIKGEYIVAPMTKIIRIGAFKDCKNLTHVSLPDTIEVIEANAFMNCENLETINFPSGLKMIESLAFKQCKKLSHVDIPETLEQCDSCAFSGSPVENDVVSRVKPGFGMIGKCLVYVDPKMVADVVLEESFPVGVLSISSGALKDCGHIRELHLPGGIKNLPFGFLEGQLEVVYLPASIEEMDNPFADCDKLKHIYVPKGHKERFQEMFYDWDEKRNLIEEM